MLYLRSVCVSFINWQSTISPFIKRVFKQLLEGMTNKHWLKSASLWDLCRGLICSHFIVVFVCSETYMHTFFLVFYMVFLKVNSVAFQTQCFSLHAKCIPSIDTREIVTIRIVCMWNTTSPFISLIPLYNQNYVHCMFEKCPSNVNLNNLP